jgi:hypothetical protein
MANLAPVVLKHYDLILWMFPKISKFPRDHKFLLGDRIENLLLDILKNLMTANYQPSTRVKNLTDVNLMLDYLRILTRLCKDLNFFNNKEYEFQAKAVDEIGRMVGGWARAQK